jgi:hypothetical protein
MRAASATDPCGRTYSILQRKVWTNHMQAHRDARWRRSGHVVRSLRHYRRARVLPSSVTSTQQQLKASARSKSHSEQHEPCFNNWSGCCCGLSVHEEITAVTRDAMDDMRPMSARY